MSFIPPTISAYFFRRYIMTFTGYALAISFMILLVDFNENARRLSGAEGYSAGLGLLISALRVPTVLQQAVPFMVLIASIATLIALNRKYELVVTRASGISAWQFLTPLIAANVMIGALSIAVLNPLAAKAMQTAEQITVDRNLGSLPGRDKKSPWLRQKTEEGDTVIGARASARGGTELSNASFIRFGTDGTVSERLEAKEAVLRDGNWDLKNVIVYKAGAAPEARASAQIPTNLTEEFVGESLASPDTVPFFELPEKIETARSYGLSTNAYATQFHRLIAQPALLAAMTLIAAMVSLKFVRFGQSLSVILGGILAGFVLYVVSELIQAFGNAGTIPPVMAAWLPVLVAAAMGTTVLLHKEDG